MRTVTFQSVLNAVASLLGMVPSRDLGPARAASLTEYVNQRVLEGWRFDFWPEWTTCEQRWYRPFYDAARNVTAGSVSNGVVTGGTEVFFPPAQLYFQALQTQAPAAQAPAILTNGVWLENSAYWAVSRPQYGGTIMSLTTFSAPTMVPAGGQDWQPNTAYVVGNQLRNPADNVWYQCIVAHTSGGAFDATKFGVLNPFDKFIGYDQVELNGTARTPMDEVKALWRRNPRVHTQNAGPIGFQPSDDGIQVDWRAPVSVWVEFRFRPPVFTASVWNAATAYAKGALAYAPTTSGECYLALAGNTNSEPSAHPENWARQTMPAILATWVKRAALADGLKDQKQTDRAAEQLQEAQMELEDAWDRNLAAQGVTATAAVATYGQ